MTEKKLSGKNKAGRVWLAPVAVFVVLIVLTVLVWRQQLDHQQSLLTNHTEDVTFSSQSDPS